MGRTRMTGLVTVGAGVMVVVACGSESSPTTTTNGAPDASTSSSSGGPTSSGGAGSDGGVTSPEQQAFAADYCRLFSPCCPRFDYQPDEARCRALLDTAPAGYLFQQAKADACIADLKTATADPAAFCAGPFFPDACNEVYKKVTAGPPGSPCTAAADCASSTEGTVRCASGAGSTRACQVEVIGKLGDACDATDKVSVSGSAPATPPARLVSCPSKDGLFCDPTTKQCATRRDLAQPCTVDVACVETARCSGNQCVARSDVGGTCSPSASSSCLDALYCEKSNDQCATPKPDGQPCDQFDECAGACESGTCVKRPPVANILYLLYCARKDAG